MSDTKERVEAVVREHLGLKPDTEINGKTTLDEMGADSLDAIELVMMCEEEFDIELGDPDLAKMKTFDDMVALVEATKAAE